jgi:hypothetical protein
LTSTLLLPGGTPIPFFERNMLKSTKYFVLLALLGLSEQYEMDSDTVEVQTKAKGYEHFVTLPK